MYPRTNYGMSDIPMTEEDMKIFESFFTAVPSETESQKEGKIKLCCDGKAAIAT